MTQEKTRRQELEILLRKEEELRKQNEKSLADERRKNMNTTEIDNAKLRIRQLELERDAGREVYTRYFHFRLTKPYRNCEKNVKIKK